MIAADPRTAEYFALVDNKEYGPYALEQLKEFVKTSTLVRGGGAATWKAAREIPELQNFFQAALDTGKVDDSTLKDWVLIDVTGEKHGPYTRRDLEDLLRREIISPQTLIQHNSWSEPQVLLKTKLYLDFRRAGLAAPATPRRSYRAWYAAAAVVTVLVLCVGVCLGRNIGAPPSPTPSVSTEPAENGDHQLDGSGSMTTAPAVPLVFSTDTSAGGPEFFAATAATAADTSAGKLRIFVCDVGQGDGIIIQTPGNRTYLIDAGPWGEAMLPWLEKFNVKTIEAMLLTHPHHDHYAGMPAVLERYPVKTFYDAGVPHASKAYEKLLEMLLEKRIAYVTPRAGEVLDWGNGIKAEILHPDSPTYDNMNDNSIVFRLNYGSTSMLFSGDAEVAAHGAILARFRDKAKADIYKVGHHGSDNATDETWLDAIRPQIAVISCGLSNQFNHPRPSVIALLKARGIKIFRTDLMGTITLVSDGKSWTTSVAVTPYERIARAFGSEPKYRESFKSAALFSSPDWKRVGPEAHFSLADNALNLTALPGEQIYDKKTSFAVPLLLRRPLSGQNWIVVVAMKGSTARGTDGALIMFGDENNWLALSSSGGTQVDLTSCRKGRRSTETYQLKQAPRFFAFERHGDRLNIVVSADKQEWFVLCRLPLDKLNFALEEAYIGLTASAWEQTPALASFSGFEEYY